MQKIVSSVIFLAIIVLTPPSSYAATITDDFNDTTINSSLWTVSGNYYMRPANDYGADPFTFTELGDGVLSFASNDFGLAYGGRKKYDSSLIVDFSQDFQFSVQYNTPNFAFPNPENGSLEIGLHDVTTNDFEVWSGAYNNGTVNVFDATIDDITDSVNVERPDSGVIGIKYAVAKDRLDFIGGVDESDVYASIDNFTATYGSYEGFKDLRVYLEGDSEKTLFNASFDNFKFQSPSTVTPEPVSSTLFLLGGGLMALRRYRRNKR